jgi:hypothetical protein
VQKSLRTGAETGVPGRRDLLDLPLSPLDFDEMETIRRPLCLAQVRTGLRALRSPHLDRTQ